MAQFLHNLVEQLRDAVVRFRLQRRGRRPLFNFSPAPANQLGTVCADEILEVH
jgi:hypothetical protein